MPQNVDIFKFGFQYSLRREWLYHLVWISHNLELSPLFPPALLLCNWHFFRWSPLEEFEDMNLHNHFSYLFIFMQNIFEKVVKSILPVDCGVSSWHLKYDSPWLYVTLFINLNILVRQKIKLILTWSVLLRRSTIHW